MLPAEIKFKLATAEPASYTQVDVARECGVANSMVFDVIHGNRRNDRVAYRIAAIIKTTRETLWPDVYGPEAQRRRRALSSPQTTDALRAAAG